MKNMILLATVALMATPAMASKARMQALGNSRQILDFQTAFDRPYQFMALSTQATFEWGTSGDGEIVGGEVVGDRHAEGGFLTRSEDHAYGAYLGRRSDDFTFVVNKVRSLAAAVGLDDLMLEQNPLNVFYAGKMGDWTWGITGKYSNGKNDANSAKVSSAGLAIGATNGTWEVELVQGLSGKSEVNSPALGGFDYTVESKGLTKVAVGYNVNENMHAYANYGMTKVEGSGVPGAAPAQLLALNTTVERTNYSVGFINSAVKTDDVNFFYGVAYASEKQEGIEDYESTTLPLWFGVEANATSWMVFRGSIRQNIILNEVKDEAGDKADLDSIAFNAGVGFRLGKGMLDASFGTANAGHVSFSDGSAGNEFLSNVAYTYTF